MFIINILKYFDQKIGLTTAKAGRIDQRFAESISAKFRFGSVWCFDIKPNRSVHIVHENRKFMAKYRNQSNMDFFSIDYLFWQIEDRKTLKIINALIKEIRKNPYEGIGKPEPLRFDLSGFWSRRIDREHRIVYRVHQNALHILSCRYHY